MLEIGTIQNLTVVKKVDFGVYLAEPGQKSASSGKTGSAADLGRGSD